MRGMGPHPALRERGRAIPPGPPGPPPPPASRPVTLPPHIRVRSPLSVYYENEQPPPIPGMRPPLGSPGGPVPAPKSSMGLVMPIYTICIIVFFVYTLTKILFRRQGAPYDPVAPDPQFRRRVFRDDSRSSPEKLGKKEADTRDVELAALRARLAETERAMQRIVGQLASRDADVQDNARPYTNGTILLNSGPVQIVTSEYKETSKEKTPEPGNEKESTPEPKEAQPTKVEPCYKVDEPTSKSKEVFPEVTQPSPEPECILEENKTTPETVVLRQSSPELSVTERSNEPITELDESTPEPISKQPEAFLISGVDLESLSESVLTPELKQSTPEHELLQDPIPVSILNIDRDIPLSEVAKDIALVSDSKNTPSEFEESNLDFKQPLLTSIKPNELSTVSDLAPKDSSFELIKSPEYNKTSLEPEEPIFVPKEASPERIDFELNTPSLVKLPLETNETSSESEEPIVELRESSLKSEELALEVKEFSPLSIHSQEHSLDPKDTADEIKTSASQPKESSQEIEELIIELKEPSLEAIESIPESDDHSLDLAKLLLKETLSETVETIIPTKEFLLESKDSTPEPTESSPLSKDSLLETVDTISIPKGTISDLDEPLQPEVSIPELKPIIVPTSDLQEPSTFKDSDPSTYTSDIKESAHEPVIIIPEHTTVTAIIDQSILERKETTPEIIENTQEVKAPIVKPSPEPDFMRHSPELEAQGVECSSEPELTDHSMEVDAPGIGCDSDLKTDSLELKEPTPQSKEPTPERKLNAEPKTFQVEENASVTEGNLLDLEEAIADIDDSIEKQQKEEPENVKKELKAHDKIDQETTEELLKTFEAADAVNDFKDNLAKANEDFLQEERFVVVRRSTPDVIEENKTPRSYQSKPADDYKLYTEVDEDDIENATVQVMGMEMTAHPVDGSEWPLDERPPPPTCPAIPPPRAPHAAEDVKSIFLETEIPQQSRVLVAQFQEDRPRPAAHAPLVVSGKMTLSLIQDAPRETPERDPESTLDEFTTASAVTQPAAEKEDMESDEEIEEEIEVEEIELEEEEEEEEEDIPPTPKTVKK